MPVKKKFMTVTDCTVSDSLRSMLDNMCRISELERNEFEAQLADFPHTFQLKDQQRLSPNQMKRLKSGLEYALSVGYETALETARARNLLAFALWHLGRPDDALQQLDLVLDMEDQRDNLVTLANKAVMLWSPVQWNEAYEKVESLRKIQTECEDFHYLVVKAKAELAFTYTRLGPTFSDYAISTFSEVIPEAREPEKWLWKFGLALTRRRSMRAHPRSLLHSQDTSERLNLLSLCLEISKNCLSKNLKAKVFSEVALLLDTGRSTPAREDLQTATDMTRTEACEEALRLDKNDNSVLCKCGKIFRYARETERSRKLLEKAVSIRPSATGYHQLALTYKALATAEKNKDKVKVPGYYRSLEKQQQQPPSDQNPSSQNPHAAEELGQTVAGSNPTTCNRFASDADEGARLSVDREVRAKQRAIKSPPKCTTSFSMEDKFVKETLEYLLKAIDYSNEENATAIYDLALFYKSMGELESSTKYLKLMLNKQQCLLPFDRIKVFEQMGFITREMANAEKDQKKKEKLHQESKCMLMSALQTASRILPASPEGSIGEIWCSFSTLLQAVDESDRDSCNKLQERAKLLQLIKRYKSSLDLLQEIEQIEPEKTKDPQHLKLCFEGYMATEEYEKASTFLDLLKCTSQGPETIKLFSDKHFEQKVHMQAARQAALRGCPARAKSHFRSVFDDTMAANQNASSSLTSSTGDCNTSKSQTFSRGTFPETAPNADGASAMSANGPAADTKHWDVVLLHEEESFEKADSLIHVLQNACDLRVTSRYRALAPGAPELEFLKVMEKSHLKAVLVETDDHHDELLSYFISQVAPEPSTVTLLVEGAHVPNPLKRHRSFHCPDQLLRFTEPFSELNGDDVIVTSQLFAFLCGVEQNCVVNSA